MLDAAEKKDSGWNWLREECDRQNIEPRAVTAEMERILKIFHADESRDHELYAVLGLDSSASVEEVKRAYRKLSVRYHPDSAGPGTGGDPERFIAICQAYKAILARQGAGSGSPAPDRRSSNPWLYRKKSKGIPPGQKKKNILLFALLAGALLLISILAPFVYRKQVMLSQYAARPGIPARKELAGPAVPAGEKGQTGQHADVRPAEEGSRNPTETLPPASPTPENRQVESMATAVRPVPSGIETRKMVAEKAPAMTREQDLPSDPRVENPEAGKPGPMVTASSGQESRQDSVPAPKTTAPDSAGSRPGDPEKPVVVRPVKSGADQVADKARPIQVPTAPPAPAGQRLAHAKVLPRIAETHGKAVRQKVPVQAGTASVHKNTSPGARPALVSGRKEPAGQQKIVHVGMTEELLRLRLMSFLDAYTTSYEHKDLQAFSSFFTPDAVENGASFRSLRGDYEKLFAAVAAISFTIVPETWDSVADMIRLHGRFHADLAYHDGRNVRLKGKISLLLEDRTASLKVKELAYWFDK